MQQSRRWCNAGLPMLTFLWGSWPELIVSAHVLCDSAADALIRAHFVFKKKLWHALSYKAMSTHELIHNFHTEKGFAIGFFRSFDFFSKKSSGIASKIIRLERGFFRNYLQMAL
jgi:hypothetical protein